ncbi:MAG: EAL domain-containing protein [Desulfobacter sp.]|nr:MAG: EAL domain-containing protein [Desulfobacter sp.]
MGTFDDKTLYTALQPIYSLAHKRLVGHEALVRAMDGQNRPVSPARLFKKGMSPGDSIHLDRLCRYIHIHNYKTIDDPINWLFLNVSPYTISSGKTFGSYFDDLLKACRFPPDRIVIEVVEHPIEDNSLLNDTIGYYKDLGCLIALDDFGAGHSNFDRIWTLRPDIVKLDRSFLTRADTDPGIRNLLPGIVTLLHQAGALVLMEGIETRTQAMMAIESDVDFVQGFFFSTPFTDLRNPPAPYDAFNDLMTEYKNEKDYTEQRYQQGLHRYRNLFSQAVGKLKTGAPMNKACNMLLGEPEVVRCYQVATDGVQVGQTLVAKTYRTILDKRFKPLEDANSADWFRRHYLRRAIFHPEQLQITRPYLSITGAHMCVTLSMKFSCPSGECVLCCDLQI